MKVWIVEGGIKYEGCTVLGVFSKLEEAEKLAEASRGLSQFGYDFVNITLWEVEDAISQ